MGLATLVLVAGLLYALARYVRAWFARLDADAAQLTAAVSLEDPASPTRLPAPSIFAEPSKALSVIIPAYNEEARLPRALDEAFSYLDARRDREGPAGAFTYEVILVDDGSSDGTARVGFDAARSRGLDTVRVLRLPANRGKGAAVRAGALIARGERLLFMDADGATRMADLDALDAALTKVSVRGWPGGASGGGGAGAAAPPPLVGAAFGSRAHLAAGAAAKRSPHRNLLTRGFHLLVVAVAGPAIKDTQCGFKLFTRAAARALFGNQRLARWCFDVELAVLAARLGVPVAEVSVGWAEVPGSKVRLTSIIHMALELAAVGVGYGTGAWVARGEGELADAAAAGAKR